MLLLPHSSSVLGHPGRCCTVAPKAAAHIRGRVFVAATSSQDTHESAPPAAAAASSAPPAPPRRQLLQLVALAACSIAAAGAPQLLAPPAATAAGPDDDFQLLPSGLKVLDVRPGEGVTPRPGDTVVVHWAGFTKGYQGKRLDNTSLRDEPYAFVLGGHEAIPAFEDAVSSMKVGGIRRVEVPGSLPDLSYPRDRSQRFTDELISPDLKIFKYRYGPQPAELGGQRALDFVLDNPTLQDFNRTLLFDIKLLAVRRGTN